MNCISGWHIFCPIILAFTYIYFILLLNHILFLSIILLFVFLLLFVLYGLAVYSLFHKQPGYQTFDSTKGSQQGLSIDKIGEYKENQRRLTELVILMRHNVTFQNLKQLQSEFINRYQQPSFCNTCQIIKCPRTVHCQQCDKCVLRRQKHSQLIGSCIGIKNIKVFMQYLFISMTLSLFMTFSLLFVATLENNKVDDLSEIQLTIFSVFEIVMGGSLLLFGKQFFISYFNALDNITQTERKLSVITKKNNPFINQKYYESMFHSRLDFFKVSDIADPNDWIQFHDENQAQGN